MNAAFPSSYIPQQRSNYPLLPHPKKHYKKSFWFCAKSSLKNIKIPTERQCNIKNINSFIKSPAGVCEPSEPFKRASVRRISPKIFITFMPE